MKLFESSDNILFHELIESALNSELMGIRINKKTTLSNFVENKVKVQNNSLIYIWTYWNFSNINF